MILFVLKDILSHCDVLFFLKVKLHFKGIFCSHRNVKRVFKKGGGETTFTLGNLNPHYFTFCKQTLFLLSYTCFKSLFYKFYFICKKELCINSEWIFIKCTHFNSKFHFFYNFIIQILSFYVNFFSKNAYNLLFPLLKSIHHKYSFFYLVIHFYIFNQSIYDLLQSRMLI